VRALTFTEARLILPGGVVEGTLVARDGRIEAAGPGVEPPPDADRRPLGGRYLAPGLIDIHVHGGGGHRIMTDDPDEVLAYARWVVRHGVTSFLVSTAAPTHESLVARLRACASAIGPIEGGATALGFHLEGPFLNPDRRGAFPASWLRPPDTGDLRELLEAGGGHVRYMTLAPELPGAGAVIDALRDAGVVAALGHSDATYEEATAAFERGVSHVTHCFNAMGPFEHRDPGCLGAALTSDGVTAELIFDGAHVHPPAAELLLRAKGVDGVVLVTDAVDQTGLEPGAEGAAGERLSPQGAAVVLPDGTIAGSMATMDVVLRNAVEWLGLGLQDAARLASTNPARELGLAGRKGALVPGADADFIVLDDALRVVETYVGGERVAGR
jgi:N-acetylglucosamine-6-phosphate deacetylase